MASRSLLPPFPPAKTHLANDVDRITRQANDDMLAGIARRITVAELPQRNLYTFSVSLLLLPKPRRENGKWVEVAVRQHWLRKHPREHGTSTFFYASRADALAAWPMAKEWPWSFVETRPDPRTAPRQTMEMQAVPPIHAASRTSGEPL